MIGKQLTQEIPSVEGGTGSTSREYAGTVEWLEDAGIVNVCYCLDQLSLPLKGNYTPRMFKLYPILRYFPAEALDSECKLPR